uniref:Uncharacterized protein n=1 Tax=Chromera velia CCMP2878 TaxID=1169474 RepID=A0A0G4FUV5_9ALVE|eukprot:Cvel_18884.t1-p1 / transcript=Cvel_18884.t1 / gene=Cvel_18884 / organism=Chromera_velia_CCMP2878 / gene_product=hypothetical protein / transcript_product=hypothetical protein / location=Cvel_scaffold1590:28112-41304(-) / protein_length=919 / sequence_SO=supercontig / SO=protein_coding / is_pseudo=false
MSAVAQTKDGREMFPTSTILTVVCAKGFSGKQEGDGEGEGEEGNAESQDLQCLDGVFERPTLECKRSCGPIGIMFGEAQLRDPEAYRMTGVGTAHADEVFVSCMPGYTKIAGDDPNKMVCEDGDWVGQNIVCTKECMTFRQYALFSDPELLPHTDEDGQFVMKYNIYGDPDMRGVDLKVKISCAPTFAPVEFSRSEETLECLHGKWRTRSLHCESEGYASTGPNERDEVVCINGQWSALGLECEKGCPPIATTYEEGYTPLRSFERSYKVMYTDFHVKRGVLQRQAKYLSKAKWLSDFAAKLHMPGTRALVMCPRGTRAYPLQEPGWAEVQCRHGSYDEVPFECIPDCPEPPSPGPHAEMFINFDRTKTYVDWKTLREKLGNHTADALLLHGGEYQITCKHHRHHKRRRKQHFFTWGVGTHRDMGRGGQWGPQEAGATHLSTGGHTLAFKGGSEGKGTSRGKKYSDFNDEPTGWIVVMWIGIYMSFIGTLGSSRGAMEAWPLGDLGLAWLLTTMTFIGIWAALTFLLNPYFGIMLGITLAAYMFGWPFLPTYLGFNFWNWSLTVSTSYLDTYGYVCRNCDPSIRHMRREQGIGGENNNFANWVADNLEGNKTPMDYSKDLGDAPLKRQNRDGFRQHVIKHESYTGSKVFNNPRMLAGLSKRVQCFHGHWTDNQIECSVTRSRSSDFSLASHQPTPGNTAKKVLCTSAYRHGHMSERLMAQDTFFGSVLVPAFVLSGYHTWAKPVLWLMASSRWLAESVAGMGVLLWAEYMGSVVDGSDRFRRDLLEWLGGPLEGDGGRENGEEPGGGSGSADEGEEGWSRDGPGDVAGDLEDEEMSSGPRIGLWDLSEELPGERVSTVRVFFGGCLFWSLAVPTCLLGAVRQVLEGVSWGASALLQFFSAHSIPSNKNSNKNSRREGFV